MTEFLKNLFGLVIWKLMIGAYLEFGIWLLEFDPFRDLFVS